MNIYEMRDGHRSDKTTVVAVVESRVAHWHIVDIDYPGGGDLLGVLASLEAGRQSDRNGSSRTTR